MRGVQREEIRVGLDCVKHQDMVSDGTIQQSCTQLVIIIIIWSFLDAFTNLNGFLKESLGDKCIQRVY